jgi:di/tripeptidase
MHTSLTPAVLADLGSAFLSDVIAIDSHSDERSETIPSTEGQRTLARHIGDILRPLGIDSVLDDGGTLIAEMKGNRPGPKMVLMVHIDTARGTEAVPKLAVVPSWKGDRVPFAENPDLVVSAEHYPETGVFIGEDLLFGPGKSPAGFDDKVGVALLLTLAHALAKDPSLPRPDLVLAFRPDEEIGRHAAVVGLAGELAKRGVRFGYTVDGIAPFEVNVENFHAARVVLHIDGRPIVVDDAALAREVTLQVTGVKSHGATAKAEGYLNASIILVRALAGLSRRQDVLPVSFQSEPLCEVDATMVFHLRGPDAAALERAERALTDAFKAEITPHAWRGAKLAVLSRKETDPRSPPSDAAMRAFAHLATFVKSDGPRPLLSEESSGYQGYTNPCSLHRVDDGKRRGQDVEYRVRDFDRALLDARIAHLRALAAQGPGDIGVTVTEQYVNMGPALAPYPALVTFAADAARAIGRETVLQPIRGGTGVDPFLDVSIPVANIGTGYFAPESEKELTSRQSIGRHAEWLIALVGGVAKGTWA